MQLLTTLTDKEFESINSGNTLLNSSTLVDVPKELKDIIYYYIKECNSGVKDIGVYPVIYSIGVSNFSIPMGARYFDILGIPKDNIAEVDYPDSNIVRIDSIALTECISIINNPDISNSKAIRILKKNIKVNRFDTTKLVYGFLPHLHLDMITDSKCKETKEDTGMRYFNIGE